MIKSLTGVSFSFRTEEFPTRGLDPKEQVGFIAQDVEEILPQVVNTFNDGFKGIEYGKVTAVLVEAVKQQAEEMKQQAEEVKQQAEEIAQLKEQQQQTQEGRALREAGSSMEGELKELRRKDEERKAENGEL